MSDLVILICLLIGLVGIELARPLFKSIRDVTGIILFPFLAFLLLVIGQYVFGFRPELIPLGIYIIFVFLSRIPKLIAILQRLRSDDDRKASPVVLVLEFLLLSLTGLIALKYTPSQEYLLERHDLTEYETATMSADDGMYEYFIRTYERASQESRGTIVIIPPVSGSVEVIDSVCSLLYSQGFSVVTFSQPGFDLPAYDILNKAIYPSLKKTMVYMLSFVAGLQFKTPNELGRAVEQERLRAIEYVVSHKQYSGPLYLVGYGAGGSAAITYVTQHLDSPVKGIVNIEGPLFSALEFSEYDTTVTGIQGFFQRIKPRVLKQIGEVPVLNKPLLILVSDTVKDMKQRDSRYATLVRVMHQAQSPAVLAALTGAGPLDYSDIPVQYPLYSVLMGSKGNKVRNPAYYTESTAALIYNFICSIEKLQEDYLDVSDCTPIPVSGDVYFEYNRLLDERYTKEVLGK